MASRLELKFRWIWVNSDLDTAYGTNNEEVALAMAEEHIVIDASTGKDIGTEQLIIEVPEVVEDEDQDD